MAANLLRDSDAIPENQISLARAFDRRASSPELHGLIGTLKTIRQRILANTLLRGWTKWFVWLLIGLIAVAAVSAKLAGALLFVAVLAAVGAAAILAWTWRNRPSNYETARRFDSAAGLQDRLSTAIYPWRRRGSGRHDRRAAQGRARASQRKWTRADFFRSSCREISGALPCLFWSRPDYSPIAFTTSRRSFRCCKPRRGRSSCNRFFLPSCTPWKKIFKERWPWSR